MTKQKRVTAVEPIYFEIGERIRWMRVQKGWSAQDLGERMGVHPSTLTAWENAIARPGVAELVRIADACGADMTVFLADLDVARCQPDPAIAARRKETAQKRIAAMRRNGTFGKKRRGK